MAAEQLDLNDLDAEDMKALEEVSKKGYYHNRPKSEAAPAPQRIDSGSGGTPSSDGPVKRAEFDAFQKKWDQFDAEGVDMTESVGGHSSATRVHAANPPSAPLTGEHGSLPACDSSQKPKPFVVDEAIVAQLMSMGFGEQECRAAAIACKNRADAAVDYLINGGAGAATTRVEGRIRADSSKLELLVEMGFSEKHAREALEACQNDIDRAVDHAANRASEGSSTKLRDAREALTLLENDVAAMENDRSALPDPKRLRLLQDTLTKASCNLDSIDVNGGVATRDERRIELDRCNIIDARISRLCTAMEVGVAGSSLGGNGSGDANGASVGLEEYPASDHPGLRSADLEVSDTCEAPTRAGDTDIFGYTGLEASAACAAEVERAGCSPESRSGERQGSCQDGGVKSSSEQGHVDAAQQRIAEAERLRLDGNAAFKAEAYADAVKHYLAALELDHENVAILSNLAAAELKLGEFEAAAAHASAANDLSGGFSAKALFRKGQALEGMNHLADACQAYQAALLVEPGDKLVRQRLQACQAAEKAERRVDPMLDNRAVTYEEMCRGLADQRLNEEQLRTHWDNLQPTQATSAAVTAAA